MASVMGLLHAPGERHDNVSLRLLYALCGPGTLDRGLADRRVVRRPVTMSTTVSRHRA